MLNLKIYAILAALAIAAGIGFKMYFDYSQEQIKTLTTDISTYKMQNEAQQKAYNTMKKNFKEQSVAIISLTDKLAKVEVTTSKLSKTLARHELDKLASAKPETLKRLANKATKKVFANLEKVSQPVSKGVN